ncbi:hypothetical protein D9619_009493 [Psilocybe cf. subviscida]|uniref:NACHT domain-containing protein n=1 Tax=Psilocybe cf. subviscida TaxID=2480587 RepID=A0A8H5BTR3_9AGAR|nr:hypothetical protein D9619_009493 [Psilocybe cf. subviscida]
MSFQKAHASLAKSLTLVLDTNLNTDDISSDCSTAPCFERLHHCQGPTHRLQCSKPPKSPLNLFPSSLDYTTMSLMDERTLDDSGPHDSDSGGSMFRQASDIHIHGGTFNAFGSGGRDRTEQKKRIMDTMALLSSHAEKGAPYDAAAREDVPKCHEHTRVAIIEGVHKWAHSQEPDACPLMWMHGPAGSGKTAIMQTVAETIDKERSLAASFFFSRLSARRPKEKENFVITLAHQLSLCIPALQQPLTDALSDSSILTKSLAKQMDALVIGPLNELGVDQIGPRRIFLVDGLDECNGDTAQRDVLNLLEQFVHCARHPFRILVASRSHSHIRGFFSQAKIAGMTATMPLDNNYQSNEDVRAFLDSEFAKIRDEHPSRGGLPSQWPLDGDVKTLVARASGQFIYASVVMKFIAGHGRHPAESLQTIIDSKTGDGARPYEELDAVYAQVLSTIEAENIEFVQTLMGCLLLSKFQFYLANIVQTQATNVADVAFMLHAGTTEARINRMHPLITIKPEGGIQFAHASFPDYLLDASRSKGFFLDMHHFFMAVFIYLFQVPIDVRFYSHVGFDAATTMGGSPSRPSLPSLAPHRPFFHSFHIDPTNHNSSYYMFAIAPADRKFERETDDIGPARIQQKKHMELLYHHARRLKMQGGLRFYKHSSGIRRVEESTLASLSGQVVKERHHEATKAAVGRSLTLLLPRHDLTLPLRKRDFGRYHHLLTSHQYRAGSIGTLVTGTRFSSGCGSVDYQSWLELESEEIGAAREEYLVGKNTRRVRRMTAAGYPLERAGAADESYCSGVFDVVLFWFHRTRRGDIGVIQLTRKPCSSICNVISSEYEQLRGRQDRAYPIVGSG